jgi:uncharacterized protein YecE (DUF72 family)
MNLPRAQPDLFELPRHELVAAELQPAHVALAAQLPPGIRLGTTSWSFPGWAGIVYGADAPAKLLASDGLTAYAKHPLLRAVEIDRTYYAPLSAAALQSFAEQVPEDFRFVVKAHEDCTFVRFPSHARYGKRGGEVNPRYLDAAYATEAVVAPFREGLGTKAGVLLFQFPPQAVGEPRAFAEQLRDFLVRLPKGVIYAVEIRNPLLLTPEYAAALEEAGAVHCHNAWAAMPSIPRQARQIPPRARRPLVIRWLLRRGDTFEGARARYAPFGRVVDEDPANRVLIADLVAKAHSHGVPALVMIDNKAEGCAPGSVVHLAKAIVESLSGARPSAST